MNQRVRELINQARVKYVCHECGESPYYMEKLVESIVRECVGIVETESVRGTDHIMDQILSHFGVKE